MGSTHGVQINHKVNSAPDDYQPPSKKPQPPDSIRIPVPEPPPGETTRKQERLRLPRKKFQPQPLKQPSAKQQPIPKRRRK
jgi:hypothetical protein